MNWQDLLGWLQPAVTPLLLLAALGFIFRETLLRYVSGRINVQFDERLSIFQSQLRNKEQEVDSYRNHLLQAISSESQAVISKRIEAIEGIWKCHCQNKKLQMAASLLKPLKIDAMNQSINDPRSEQSLRIFSSALPFDVQTKTLPNPDGELFRPFLSVEVWSYYSIYETILWHCIAIWFTWNSGLSSDRILKSDDVVKSVQAIMPEYNDFLIKFGVPGTITLLDTIEAKLLSSINEMLQGKGIDAASAERAQKAFELAHAGLSQLTAETLAPLVKTNP